MKMVPAAPLAEPPVPPAANQVPVKLAVLPITAIRPPEPPRLLLPPLALSDPFPNNELTG